ncbi:hypothetical protein MKW94_002056 [Papaver nudicaule]|uniref:Transmembrane protein n=1 Tax=Papaver nudicaule TaxID=74823 RepID=A0AA41VUN2_PAPNU|nr:hypothetical protein [Papaver nudicaule]
MAKTSSLVICFVFVMLAVLQSAYAGNNGFGPGCLNDVCDPSRIGCMTDFGNVSSCDMCSPICVKSLYSVAACVNSTNTGSYVCKCCGTLSLSATAAAATTTSILFLSFSLFLSFISSCRLFI